jgi:RNA polymerase sigma-70 factor (ECF subfamily)
LRQSYLDDDNVRAFPARSPAGAGGPRLTMAQESVSRASAAAQLKGWIESSAAGDQGAFAALYDATSPVVFGVALRILSDRGEAEEVATDVFLQVWRDAARFDPSRGSAIAWLLLLTRSRAIDRLRSRKTARQAERSLDFAESVPDEGRDPGERSWISQQGSLVRRSLAALPAEQRAALELAYFEGLTHPEIAERLQVPVGTAKTRIRLGMMKLRDALAPALALEGAL